MAVDNNVFAVPNKVAKHVDQNTSQNANKFGMKLDNPKDSYKNFPLPDMKGVPCLMKAIFYHEKSGVN